ncbi:transposase [Nostoc sp. CENA67]|uniref:Transposase n=1 Tax=Amazonocrinis nigriterrae CENA67 TaxID=2794033 RepID=A0A8J7L987_9NOST|nr:helix-turn-helix domain-containing protein [Amazonocrinis nigriterrae]MBH8564002.1 transposase [Amazonocrinis nigriterrae CENA67]MBH8564505.1 transposase [Amazonocrinis nigriterrae CENA67]MBH8565150.1 transposase [Amazonocrinis nigriterrae CENA67]MBH8565309.1 transposase [Amazonocrinis nigriterrae CENA67]MBH8566059.1 transposase [Amazonocrinis nigriterrae CENA67]
MPAPYSTDLRQRVINAYESKQGSQRQLAERFQVSVSFIKRLIRRYRDTGQVTSLPHGGGAIAKIRNSSLAVIEQLVDEQPDAILEELCSGFAAKSGVEVSVTTMHRAVQRLKLTTKKNTIC